MSIAKGPFVLAALDYLRAGWHPFPACHTRDKSKAPCVKKVIGWDAIDITTRQLKDWALEYRKAQLGIRVPHTVLGIDIDAYGEKAGRETARGLSRRFGPLPKTWRSTSRQDGLSGIYLYRVPDSRKFPHALGQGIETIRSCGRFLMVMPSTHPRTGAPYGYYRPDGAFVLDEFPAVADLPALPSLWVEGLATLSGTARPPVDGLRVQRDGKPCSAMRATFRKWDGELADAFEGSRHDTALRGVHALIGDASEGHVGLHACLDRLERRLSEVRGSRAGGEFRRMVATEMARRVILDDRDPCAYTRDWALR